VDDLWATKSEGVGLIVRAVSFQDFQPMIHQRYRWTDRQMDGQTTCDSKTTLFSVVHCAVKTEAAEYIASSTGRPDGRTKWVIWSWTLLHNPEASLPRHN